MNNTKKNPQQDQVITDEKEIGCSPAECYNAKSAAELLGKTPVTISNWKKQGKINPNHYHGKRGYYSLQYLQSYLPKKPISSVRKTTQSSCSSVNCLTIKQTATFLGKSVPTLYGWIKEGKISPDHKAGKRFHFTKDQLQSYQHAYKTSIEQPDTLEATDTSSEQVIEINPPLLTSPTYETEALLPFKTQSKVLDVLIASSNDQPQVLFVVLGMLITLVIKLLLHIKCGSELLLPAFQLQEEYLQLQIQQQVTPQGVRNSDLRELVEESPNTDLFPSNININIEQSQDKISSEPAKKKKNYALTLWQKAVVAAGPIFVKLTRLANDHRLDQEERERGKLLLNKILGPYKRVTKYIAEYDAGTARHDVALLILTKRPQDFNIDRKRWTVRSLAYVCARVLKTKQAKKSTIGNILKELQWNCAIKPKLISCDPQYGPIILHLSLIFNNLRNEDLVIFNDEFKFTSSKIAEYLKKKRAPAGLNMMLPFMLHRPFYKTKAALKLSGLLTGKTKFLLLKELDDGNFDGYYKVITELLEALIEHQAMDTGGKLYLVIDNAPNHQPNILRHLLLEKFGGRVEVLILPKYAPNHNLIERVWKFLLEVTERAGNTDRELKLDLDQAVEKYNQYSQDKGEVPLKLHCDICDKKWIFTDETRKQNEVSLRKHLCFRIEGLNPYIIYVLTHSLETLQEMTSTV